MKVSGGRPTVNHTDDPDDPQRRIVLLAPTRRDGELASTMMSQNDLSHAIVANLPELLAELDRGAATVLMAEESLRDGSGSLNRWLSRQPTWSDLPIVVLYCGGGRGPSPALLQLQQAGNVTLVGRPIRMSVFLSTIRSKLRDRQRQYDVRDLINRRTATSRLLRRSRQRLTMSLRAGGQAAWEWRPGRMEVPTDLDDLLSLPRGGPWPWTTVIRRIHREDRRDVLRAWRSTVRDGEPLEVEFRVRSAAPDADPADRWIACVGETIRGGVDGGVRRVHGILRDVTVRREAESRQRHRLAQERFLSGTSMALASSLDLDRTLCEVTRLIVEQMADWAFIDLIHYPAIGMPDLPGDDGVPPIRRVAVSHRDGSLTEIAEQVRRYSVDLLDSDSWIGRVIRLGRGQLFAEIHSKQWSQIATDEGHMAVIRRIRPRSAMVVPLLARERVLGSITILRNDAAEPVYTPEDLNLANQVADRAAVAIDNAMLFAAGQAASDAKSEFVANMSHEIRTPMTAILGYTNLLAADEDDAEKADFLRTIRRNGEFLLDIINDILDLSKIEAGKMETRRANVDVDELVRDVYSIMRVRAIEKKLTFEVRYENPLPPVIQTDDKRLRQVLINLVGNAIKFTHSGHVRLVVAHDRAGGQMRFTVADTGPGMTPAQQGRLFQPFAQGDSSVNRSFGGTGLGLSISRRLARLLGGDVTFTSETGVGSEFTCQIDPGAIAAGTPIDLQPPTGKSDAAAGQVAQKPASQKIKLNCRVLVVDDRRDVRFLTDRLLRDCGATVESVTDGIEALQRIAQQSDESAYDLVLLDMQMPRMDGYETATRLRQLGYTRPIVALTADAMHGDMQRCLRCGCDDFLSKPIDRDQLLATVAKHSR